jgi:hypothetical protein
MAAKLAVSKVEMKAEMMVALRVVWMVVEQ